MLQAIKIQLQLELLKKANGMISITGISCGLQLIQCGPGWHCVSALPLHLFNNSNIKNKQFTT
jgi:hypothetical protein